MYQSWAGIYCSGLSNTGCKYYFDILRCTKVGLAAIALGCPTQAVSTILISCDVPKLGWHLLLWVVLNRLKVLFWYPAMYQSWAGCYCSGLSYISCKYYFDILQCTKVGLAAIALGCLTPAVSTILLSCNGAKLGWLPLLWVVLHRL